MRVGLLTYGMETKLTGIGRYAVELSRGLRRVEPKIELILLNPYPNSALPWYHEFKTYSLPQLARLPALATLGNVSLHRAATTLKLDILHDPCGVAPFLYPGADYRRVTTVHDAIPFLYPETQPLLSRLVFETLVRRARATADAVVTVSHSATRDLERYLPGTREIYTTHLGVTPPAAVPKKTQRQVQQKFGLDQLYLLYVGALHPRKNLHRVVTAFSHLREEGIPAQLAIVGPQSWGAHDIFKRLQGHAENGVILTGYVSDEELQALYAGARALVFPSLYEGFGLPAAEAMAHGTPVISSDVSSLPEVVGDAGLLVDPHNIEAITAAMRRLWLDDTLYWSLSQQGLVQAKRFSWDDTARKTLTIYQSLPNTH